MLKEFCISRCYFDQHLQPKNRTWNDAIFINLLTVEIRVGWNLNVDHPPHSNLAQKCHQFGKLRLVCRLNLPSHNGEKLVGQQISCALQFFKSIQVFIANSVLLT